MVLARAAVKQPAPVPPSHSDTRHRTHTDAISSVSKPNAAGKTRGGEVYANIFSASSSRAVR